MVEITCCDYLKERDEEYLICGLTSGFSHFFFYFRKKIIIGEVAVVQYKSFEVVFQKKVAENELVDMFVSHSSRKIICTCLDSSIYFMEYDRL